MEVDVRVGQQPSEFALQFTQPLRIQYFRPAVLGAPLLDVASLKPPLRHSSLICTGLSLLKEPDDLLCRESTHSHPRLSSS